MRFIFSIFIIFISLSIFSQPYGNEWINYSNKYYKFPILKEGIYRISRQALANGGFPINNIDPRSIQIYIKGKEHPIYIHGESDGIFHPTDYIEFYAPANDGWLDSLLFNPISDISNPYYNMFNDTLWGFITWNQSFNNYRATLENDTAFSDYNSWLSTWCMHRAIWHNPLYYYSGADFADYKSGEGWFDNAFIKGASTTKTITTNGFYQGNEPALINYAVTGASNAPLALGANHHLRVSVNNVAYNDNYFIGYNTIKDSIILPTPLNATTTVKMESVDDLNLTADRMTVAYLTIDYQRNFDLYNEGELKFKLPSLGGSKRLVQFTNANSNNSVLWNIKKGTKITVAQYNNKLNALVPDNGINSDCYFATSNNINNVTIFRYFEPVNYLSNIGNANYLIITHKSLWSSANDYKNYRNSTGHTAHCIDIEQLYVQFSYGIDKHPLSIKNFIKYAFDKFPVQPEYVFLIGKAIHSGKWLYYECFRKDSANYARCLVPSYGSPSSDHMLISGINTNKYMLPLAIGRLAATKNLDVTEYLNKVQEFENQQVDMWMKNVLHFGGGQSASEQSLFKNYLLNYESIISDTLFGANVHTFLKTTSSPIQITMSDSIRSLINNGCSVMNFFGHGSSSGFDQNIDEPQNYNNKGKYPLLIANSCLTGDIHLPPPLKIGEKWILTPNKGAIAYLASVDVGFSDRLNIFTTEFYRNFSHKSYGLSIGKQIKNTVNTLVDTYGNSNHIINTTMDFTLHGDPALIINSPALPDLYVDNSSIRYQPDEVTTANDSFKVFIKVYNIGMAVADTFMIELTRTYPDNQSETYYKPMLGCINSNEIHITVPTNLLKGPGPNRFCVKADSENWIAELSETNNSVCSDLIIISGDLTPIYPYEFAIYPNSNVSLKASSGFHFSSPQQCIFEIDTTDLFNSPFKKQGIVNYNGGIAEWTPPFSLTDSMVYYWRVSIIPEYQGNYNWRESSFIYIPEKTGWSQAHYFQFKKDDFRFINYNRPDRKFDFITTPREITCLNIGSPASTDFINIKYTIEGSGDYSSCGPGGAMIVVVIQPQTLIPWESDKASFGQSNYPKCFSRNRTDRYFVFSSSASGLNSMANFINNDVPDGYYLLVYSFRLGNFKEWTNSQYFSLENLGATHLRTIENNYPYIFFCKKGDLSTATTLAGTSATDVLELYYPIYIDFNYGYIKSTLIGPSTKWSTLHWRFKESEFPSKDITRLKLTAISPLGNRLNIFESLSPDTLDIFNLYDYVDATLYPNLEMEFFTRDDSLQTPSQLQRWQITYDGIPETAINPSKGLIFFKDTLQEGEDLIFGVATENISDFDMDSLLVKYWITDRNNNYIDKGLKRLRPHPAGDVLIDTIKINTHGLAGLNRIWYEVNAINPSTQQYDQLEQYHFNNIIEMSFYVSSDKENPILDVTFDGKHIINGELVSAKPHIVIRLKDENKFLALNDTSLFAIYIRNIKSADEKRIHFNNTSIINFTPAQLPNNSCRIDYRPIFNEDGIYELRIQAKDVSANESGDFDYIIRFEVINKSTITNVYNYPNPFSTSTRFVFTLTGSEIPTHFRIQILTVTGKVVREIGLDEIGFINIGNNITDFAWDGTDQFGDRLANGVYFYRVITKINNSTIEHRISEGDNFFNKGFGKMYLMR